MDPGLLSPTFWAPALDELLVRLNEAGFYTQAYADDLLLIVSADDETVLVELMRQVLSMVEEWCRQVDLTVNPDKTVVNFSV